MCKYCNADEMSLFPDEFLISKSKKIIKWIAEELSVNTVIIARNKNYYLNSYARFGDGDSFVFDFEKKINYCPMCGRKLEVSDDE